MLEIGVTSIPTGNSKIIGMGSAMMLHYGDTAKVYLGDSQVSQGDRFEA
jgi:TPP-dependent pyruvate/acetoin dehydrogenase alpha subunit